MIKKLKLTFLFQRYILFLLATLLLNNCVTEFIPHTSEYKELLVVEGLITNMPEAYTIKLSRPQQLGLPSRPNPVVGCVVNVSDDSGQSFSFSEKAPGIYVSNPSDFQGVVGRFYTLHITTDLNSNNLKYESVPMELRAVPPIDSIYYEKVTLAESSPNTIFQEGCKIFLDTHDSTNQCKYLRWEYSETWEVHIPYTVPNNTCWITNNSDVINIKSTTVLAEDKVLRYPLNLVTNSTDKLATKYSIQVNQYSMNEDEYLYWEKSLNTSEQVGGLYDMLPASVPSNVYNSDYPDEKVLGYFSVSGKTSKRIFVKDRFSGVLNPYTNDICIADTIWGVMSDPIRDLGTSVWVIISHPLPPPAYRVTTRVKDCYDCTLRGSNIKPDFWQ
jgi:hypothetical protein